MICSSVNRFRFIAGPPRGHPSRFAGSRSLGIAMLAGLQLESAAWLARAKRVQARTALIACAIRAITCG